MKDPTLFDKKVADKKSSEAKGGIGREVEEVGKGVGEVGKVFKKLEKRLKKL